MKEIKGINIKDIVFSGMPNETKVEKLAELADEAIKRYNELADEKDKSVAGNKAWVKKCEWVLNAIVLTSHPETQICKEAQKLLMAIQKGQDGEMKPVDG